MEKCIPSQFDAAAVRGEGRRGIGKTWKKVGPDLGSSEESRERWKKSKTVTARITGKAELTRNKFPNTLQKKKKKNKKKEKGRNHHRSHEEVG